jgi:hypothetical protein
MTQINTPAQLYAALGVADERALKLATENRTLNHIAAGIAREPLRGRWYGVQLFVVFPEHQWVRSTVVRFPFTLQEFDAALYVLDQDAEEARALFEMEVVP